MQYLIKNAKIVHAGHPFNGKRKDIFIKNGVIAEIGKNLKHPKATEVKGKSLSVSIGWIDIGTHIGEPGNEHRETLDSLCAAALAGGYTDIAPFPNASPTIQTSSQIKNLVREGADRGVNIHPIGALSQDTKGGNLAEHLDMIHNGAVAVSDGLHPVAKNGLLLRALQYTQRTDTLVIHHPTDESLSNDSAIHEGMVSMHMGLKGNPSVSEHIMVDRDIQLQEYTDGRLCLHAISSKGTINKIKKAANDNLYCSVAYLNLVGEDKDLRGYNSNYKVDPPLRSSSDKNALIKAVKSGTIDYICSNHKPLEVEVKELEFPYAKCGATGLETLYAALHTYAGGKLSDQEIIPLITTQPRALLGITSPELDEGSKAQLTVWDSNKEWSYTSAEKQSKSANNPFLDQKLIGRVVATINGKSAYTL